MSVPEPEEDPVLVRDVMRRHPVTARPHHPAAAVAALLLDRQVGAVPVVTAEGALCGIVDEGRLVRALAVAADAEAVPVVVAELMAPASPPAAPGDDLRVAVELLVDGGTPIVPVVEGGCLVGVVTPRDLLGALLPTAAGPDPVPEVAGRLAVYDALTRALAPSPAR